MSVKFKENKRLAYVSPDIDACNVLAGVMICDSVVGGAGIEDWVDDGNGFEI
jgi:hypothetical protein